jgi:16S rRNA A1518/A1519 N6-dimethyltransferase RsmA/KsgA/DIM1 with predicted DNA glycosylase/AP lyase activity
MRFGRHELVSNQVIKELCDSADVEGKVVLEIGAGTGNITAELVKRTTNGYAVEIDPLSCSKLRKRLTNVEVINADVLSIDFPECDRIIGNIPFDISTPLVEKVIRTGIRSSLIVQREFAEKLVSDMLVSRLGFITQYLSDVEIISKVSRSAYMPRPPVDTCIISIKPKKTKADESLFDFASEVIKHRRKTLLNTLLSSKGLFKPMEKAKLREHLKGSLGDLVDLRPWDLYHDEIIKVYSKLGDIVDKKD